MDLRQQTDSSRLALDHKAEKQICWSRHKYYYIGLSPNTLLAQKLVPRPFNLALPKSKIINRDPTQNPQLIVLEIFHFYAKLYSAPRPFLNQLADRFFQDLSLSNLT